MDVDDLETPEFGNRASPYAHYWLSSDAVLKVAGPLEDMRQNAAGLSAQIELDTEDLIERAFKR